MIFFNSKSQCFVIVLVNVVFGEMDREHAKKSFVSLLQNIVDVNEKRVGVMKKIRNLEDFIMTPSSLSDIHDLDNIMEDDSESVSDEHAFLNLINMKSHLNLPLLRRTYRKKPKATNNINIVIPLNRLNIKSHHGKVINYLIGNRNNYYGKVGSRNNDNGKENNLNNDNINVDNAKHYKQNDYDGKYDINDDNYDKMGNRNDDYYVKDYINNYNENIGDETFLRKSWRGSCNKRAAKSCKKACVTAYKNVCMLYKCSRRVKKAYKKECKSSCKSTFGDGGYSDSDSDY